MLYVTKGENGVDTGVRITSESRVYTLIGKTTTVPIDWFIHEDNADLPDRFISATLNWNDGTLAVSYPKTSGGLLHISTSRSLAAGSYVIALKAQNYAFPQESTVGVNLFTTVVSQVGATSPAKFVFGPILPRDSGYPNTDQWEFNMDADMLILESSAKMLLLTAKGDRIMEPSYGTDIRKLLFEQNQSGVESLIQEEVVNAFATWEPRLEVGQVNVTRDPNGRSATLSLVLVSKLNRQPFETNLQYVR